MRILFQSDSGDIRVYETNKLFGENGAFRVLQFADEAIQGIVDLNRPERVVFEYAQAMIHLMKVNDPLFEGVFAIGHGAGAVASHFPDKRFKIAEIDERVVELSRRFFGYTSNNVTIGDGRRLLADERPRSFDYILLDAFTAQGMPGHLTSEQFFRMASGKLESWGALIANLIGPRTNGVSASDVYATLRAVFPYVSAFAPRAAGPGGTYNIVMIAGRQPIRYVARYMADFVEIEPAGGHIIGDSGSARRSGDV